MSDAATEEWVIETLRRALEALGNHDANADCPDESGTLRRVITRSGTLSALATLPAAQPAQPDGEQRRHAIDCECACPPMAELCSHGNWVGEACGKCVALLAAAQGDCAQPVDAAAVCDAALVEAEAALAKEGWGEPSPPRRTIAALRREQP